jgi:hypothetical protein
MSRAFIPSWGRRRSPPAPEPPRAPSSIKPLVWTARTKRQCELAKFKDNDGKPLCEGEGMFYPKGNQRTCSQKCSDILAELTFKATQRRSRRKNRAKITAKQRESRAANRADFNAKQRDYRKRSGYNAKQQKYRAGKKEKIACECGCGCGSKFPRRSGTRGPLSNLCPNCRNDARCVAAHLDIEVTELRSLSSTALANRICRKKKKDKQTAKG